MVDFKKMSEEKTIATVTDFLASFVPQVTVPRNSDSNYKEVKNMKENWVREYLYEATQMTENPFMVSAMKCHTWKMPDMGNVTNSRVAGRVVVGSVPIRVWYALGNCFYGNYCGSSTVVRIDREGMTTVEIEKTIHADEKFNPEHGGMKPLDWKVAKEFTLGKKVFSMPNQKSASKITTSVPILVKADAVEFVVHGKTTSMESWLNNYRKLFVEQPFRLSSEVIEQFRKDSEGMAPADVVKAWAGICEEAKK